MVKSMIKNIIFDCGGVILKQGIANMGRVLSRMFPLSLNEAGKIWMENRKSLLIGELDPRDFLRDLKRKFGSNFKLDELIEKWNTFYNKGGRTVNWKLLNLISKFRSKYNIYILSNTMKTYDEYVERNVYKKFKRVFKSFEEKVKKPDKNAYLNLLRKIKAQPKECIFIDDGEKNVKVAIKIGMKGIVYKNNSQFKKELKKLGLLS